MKTAGWVLFILAELIGFIGSIIIVGNMFGTIGIIIGIFIFPAVLVIVPIYALITTGNWFLLVVVYGVGILSRILMVCGNFKADNI